MLSAEQIEHYRTAGFVVLPTFLDTDTLANLRAAYDEVIGRQVVAPRATACSAVSRVRSCFRRAHTPRSITTRQCNIASAATISLFVGHLTT